MRCPSRAPPSAYTKRETVCSLCAISQDCHKEIAWDQFPSIRWASVEIMTATQGRGQACEMVIQVHTGQNMLRDMEAADGITSWLNAKVELSFSFFWFSSSILRTDEIVTCLSLKADSSVARGRCVPERGRHSGRDYPDRGWQ